jgi:hypothetical protein
MKTARVIVKDETIGRPITKKYQVCMACLSKVMVKPEGNFKVTLGYNVSVLLSSLFPVS